MEPTLRHLYFASPIDDADMNLAALRQCVKDDLLAANVNVYDPAGAFSTPQPDCSSHLAINNLAISTSWGMLAILKAGVASIGVPMEIKEAVGLGLPVVVITDIQSRQLAAMDVPMFGVDDWGRAIGHIIHLFRTWDYKQSAVQILKVAGSGRTPDNKRRSDAGLDLYVATGLTPDGVHRILPGETRLLPCEIAVQLPEGTWGFIIGRSSALWSSLPPANMYEPRKLLVTPGVIDEEFRGPLFVGVLNVGNAAANVHAGERIGQLIIMPNHTTLTRVLRVEQLDPSERGEHGFGSSGL